MTFAVFRKSGAPPLRSPGARDGVAGGTRPGQSAALQTAFPAGAYEPALSWSRPAMPLEVLALGAGREAPVVKLA